METMSPVVEVWPLAADEFGIWLLDSDAWRSPPIPASSEPHFEVEGVLHAKGVREVSLLHSTSWRPDGPHIVLTYVAVLHVDGLVRAEWPDAQPVSKDLLPSVGNPLPHQAAEVPVPRYIDVLHHGLRHLAFLLQTDSSARDELTGYWRQWLAELQPALAGMYDRAQSPITLPNAQR
jgi:hypothetical protein